LNIAASYNLPSIFDIASAEKTRSEIMDLFATEAPVSINCSEVTKITSPGFQVIVATAKYCKEHGIEFSLKNVSDAMKNACNLLGLEIYFKEWSES
jgi:anti-anti-sigma factor